MDNHSLRTRHFGRTSLGAGEPGNQTHSIPSLCHGAHCAHWCQREFLLQPTPAVSSINPIESPTATPGENTVKCWGGPFLCPLDRHWPLRQVRRVQGERVRHVQRQYRRVRLECALDTAPGDWPSGDIQTDHFTPLPTLR